MDTDKVEFEFPGKVSVKIGDFISISDEVSMSADYYVYVDLPRFKLRATVTGNHDLKTDWTIDSDKILEWLGHDKEKSEPEWATPVWPIVSIPGVFNFGVRAGAFLAPSVKLSLTGSTPLTFSHTFGVEFSNTDTWSWIPTVTPIMSAHSELGTPEITLSLEGKLFAGIALGVKTVLIGDKVLSGDITGRFGPEFDAKMQMQQKLGDDDQFDWYSLLKDSKMGVQLKADAKVKAKVFGENLTDKLSWEWKWPIPQWSDFRYLFPDFTKPELRHWSMANPLSMYTTPSRDLIMPVQVGIGLFDASGVKQADYYNDGWYLLDVNWHDKDTRIDIGNLTPGETYTCRPLLNFMGLGEIKADPRTSFTVPQPVSLETTTITVQKDKAQLVAINGGWGDYSVTVLDKSVCTAELKQEGDSYYIQIVGKKDGGSTSVTLKDLRSQKTAAVIVSVTDEVVQKLIKVEPKEIAFGEVEVGSSKSATFTVSNVGTASLTVTVASGLDEGDDCVLTGSGQQFTLAVGQSKTFTLTYTPTQENSGFNAIVRILSDAENDTEIVTVSGRSYKASVDPVAYTSCPDSHHPHLIDLGLPSGTKWACCNVGASKPEDYGGYFAWGETTEKSRYYWDTYIHCDGSYETCHDIGKDIAGTQYDAATANWGSPWVMPSKEQMEELKNSCTSEWTTENGVNGRRFIGPNGASIFLPAAGYRWEVDLGRAGSYGDYWSSTLYESRTDNAWYLSFGSGGVYAGDYVGGRGSGLSVRPVRKN
ncbi:MAG: choice-of-anchor D domain-containing protein [Prevotella sp.]|nr:choice-of-anchor D domain-containing protein [Prevotella sp.]